MKILFLGDSITAGSRGTAVGYPVYIEKYLKDKYSSTKFDILNMGVWGDQTVDLINMIESGEIEVSGDIIFLFIGVNDTLKNFDDNSLSAIEFENRYEKLVSLVKSKTNAPIVILEPYLICDEPMRSYKRSLLIQFNEKVYKVAKKYANYFIALDSIMKAISLRDDITTYTVDGLHLSDKGAKFVASNCFEALDEILKTSH